MSPSTEKLGGLIDVGGVSPVWLGLRVFVLGVFVAGLLVINWPPIDKGFEPGLPSFVNWILWIAVNGVVLFLLLRVSRDVWVAISTQIRIRGVIQSAIPGRPTALLWSDINRVRSDQEILELLGDAGSVRLNQEFYKDPERLVSFLGTSIPATAMGREALQALE